MLQNIRDVITGWVAVAIVILLIIPFAFWGINYYFDQGTQPVVATVNDKEIRTNQFQVAYSNFRKQMQALLGDKFNVEDDEILKKQTLVKLVNSQVLTQKTTSSNLQISDNTVTESIKNIKAFNDENGFNQAAYEYGVYQLGMTPGMYEAQLRLDLASEQLQFAIIESEFVTDMEAELIAKLEDQQRDISYTILSVNQLKDSIDVSEEEINSHYNNFKQSYMTDEQIKIAYIDLTQQNLTENIEIVENDLRAYYEQNKSRYDLAEQRKFRQLVVDYQENATEQDINLARETAEKVKFLVDSGLAFEEIAEKHSEELGKDFQYIEHGFIGKNVLPEEIDSVIFNMQPEDVSDILHSTRRFHIIQLDEIKGGEENTFENAREMVLDDYKLAQAEEHFLELADQLATLTYEHPDTLDVAAESLGLQVEESEYFGRKGMAEGSLAHVDITNASFSDDVLYNGKNSDLLELSDNRLLVLRVIEHKERKVKPVDQVRDLVIQDVKLLKASNELQSKGNEIINELREGKSFEEISNSYEIDWIHKDGTTRLDASIKRALNRAIFKLGRPVDNRPVFTGLSLGTGDFAIIAVRNVVEQNVIDPKKIAEIKNQIRKSRSGLEWEEFMQSLRDKSEIVTFPDNI